MTTAHTAMVRTALLPVVLALAGCETTTQGGAVGAPASHYGKK